MATAKRGSSTNGIRKMTRQGGKVSYEARINAAGKMVSKTFKTKAEALTWRTQALSQIHTGSAIPSARQSKVTVEDAIDAYTKHRLGLKKMSSNQLTEYMKVKADLGNSPIKSLTTPMIEQWLSLLQSTPKGNYKDGRPMAPYAEASARKFFYALKTSIEWHGGQHRSLAVSPSIFKLSKSTKPRAWSGHRERRLRVGEEEQLYAGGLTRKGCYTREDWQDIIGFALETAMREQEIFLAEFDDVTPDGELLRIYADNTKTSVGRYIPLSEQAKNIIKSQKKSAPDGQTRIFHQFPSVDAIGNGFSTLCKRVKITNLTFHDLRHEAISRMCIKHEMTSLQIMQMTGHTSMATFLGYMQLYDMQERKALKAAQAQTNAATGVQEESTATA